MTEPALWRPAKLTQQELHEHNLRRQMAEYHKAVGDNNWTAMSYTLKMAAFHCEEARKIREELNDAVSGGHKIK